MGYRNFNSIEKFGTPEEELSFLREQLALKQKEIDESKAEHVPEEIISEKIEQYKQHQNPEVLSESFSLSKPTIEGIALNLAPENHDKRIKELFTILKAKGIKNTLSILDELKDPHLTDDFHRFLVQYVKEGISEGLEKSGSVYRASNMTLYEVALPDSFSEQKISLKELLSSMEQFYSGMLSISPEKNPSQNYLSLEIANANNSSEFIFYVSVPNEKKALFEKQILSIFHNARITETPDDYNIFNEEGVSLGSYASFAKKSVFPVKTYKDFDHDPLNVILNSFSKIDKVGEGAAIQVIFRPSGNKYLYKFNNILSQVKKGVLLKDIPDGLVGEFAKSLKGIFFDKPKKEKEEVKPVDENIVEKIQKKISSPVVECNIRIAVSARSKTEAEEILSDIESSFNQFEDTRGNLFKFHKLNGSKLQTFLKKFSFRVFEEKEVLPVNLEELTTIMHFNIENVQSSSLRKSKAGSAPAPIEIEEDGILLGVNKYRNEEKKIYLNEEDRLRHLYVIGQTGTGKSTLLKSMIIQDVQQGNGVCMIDPHGVDVLDVLANIPENRYEDLVYFDPSYAKKPMALNMLEYDPRFPEQKTFVVNELFSIFQKLYGSVPESMGPMFEQYFRNATMLVIEDPDTGSTLLDVSRVMSNKAFRDLKVARCKNPVVVQFWKEIAEKAGGEASLANIVPYITSKFDVFLANEIMRPIISQEKSSFNFREMMDNKKIFLVNLAKGRLGDINANLIGLILVGKILMASLSRVDSIGKNLPPFYLYIDEFQNITTDSISTILSEARKYKLGLNIAHQFIAQLEESIKDAVFGNVGSIASFRIGAEDSEFLESQFEPIFHSNDLMNLDNRNAIIKMLVNGRPTRPFNIVTLPPPVGDMKKVPLLKDYSYEKFGRDKDVVERDIMRKYGSQ